MQAKAMGTTRRGGVQVVLISAVTVAVAALAGTAAATAAAPAATTTPATADPVSRIRLVTGVNRKAPWIVGLAVTGLSLALGDSAPARNQQA